MLPGHRARHRALWQRIGTEAKARIHAVAIHASDVSFRMVDFARRNAERAGVAAAIDFKTAVMHAGMTGAAAAGRRVALMLNPP